MKKLLTILLFAMIATFAKGQAYIGADGAIHPTGSFPVMLSNEAKGTPKRVKTLTQRDAIPATFRDTGMLCWVTDSSKFYVLVGGTANVNWADLVASGIGGNGTGVTVETDPIFVASPAHSITTRKMTYWDSVGFMIRADSARQEMHDSIAANIVNYDTGDFSLIADTLHSRHHEESDPVFSSSEWPGQVGNIPIWNAKVDQKALDDTAAALRALNRRVNNDTILFDKRHFYKDNTPDSVVHLRLRTINGQNLYGDSTDNITITGGSGGSSDTAVQRIAAQNDTILRAFTKTGFYDVKIRGAGGSGSVAQVNADWNATTGVARILNKPVIPDTSSLSNRINQKLNITDTIGQRNADWNATSGVSMILNKPTIYAPPGDSTDYSVSTFTTIYSENAPGEATVSSSSPTINPDNLSFPLRQIKSLDVGGWTQNDYISFTYPVVKNATAYTFIRGFIRLKQAVPVNQSLGIQFFNSGVAVSQRISIVNYGLDKNLINQYQNIVIQMNAFGFTSNTFNEVRLNFGGVGTVASGLYLDLFQFQNATASENTFVTDIFRTPGTKNVFKVIGGQNVLAFVDSVGAGSTSTTVDTTSLSNRINAKENPLTFNAPLSRSANTVSADTTTAVTGLVTKGFLAAQGYGTGTGSGNQTLQQTTTFGNTTNTDIEITDATKGVIMKSPNGTRWRLTVNNDGTITTTSL